MENKKRKFNIIDLIVLLVLVALIALAAWYFLRPKTDTEGGSQPLSKPTVRFSVLCDDLSPEIAEQIITTLQGEPRDIDGLSVTPRRIFNSNQLIDAEVTAWETLPRDDGTVALILTVDAAPAITSTTYTVGYQELRVGVNYNVKTFAIEISGKVLSLETLS